jgi:hypothetical protein
MSFNPIVPEQLHLAKWNDVFNEGQGHPAICQRILPIVSG